jgi:23S rRNA (guanosine2251-2'-O)-methyltransferase
LLYLQRLFLPLPMENETKLFGIRAVLEAIENKQTLDKVWIIKESKGDLMRQLLKSLEKNNISYAWVPAEKFIKYQNKNHQGVMAQIAPISFISIENLVENTLEDTNQHPLFIISIGFPMHVILVQFSEQLHV